MVERRNGKLENFDGKMAPMESGGADLVWHTPSEEPFRLAGFPWHDRDRAYRRMPVVPKEPLPEAVDWLAWCTAGGQAQFQTNSRRVAVRVSLRAPADMVHMPATGQCGFDVYVGPPGEQVYYNTTKYDLRKTEYEVLLFEHEKAQMRNFTLNFPLYQGVDDVKVGLDTAADVEAPPPYALDGPVVIYGTSITQGGCASRPGMAYTNILSRRLNVQVVNLGFSGSGKGEPEVARTIAGIPGPALLILDYEANCHPLEKLKETLPEFIRILRARHPDAPILVVSRIQNGQEKTQEAMARERRTRLEFQRQTVERLRKDGDANISFLDGSALLGDDFDECTVDGAHPTDLGFYRMARGIEPTAHEMLF